jgi:hypothetical protein
MVVTENKPSTTFESASSSARLYEAFGRLAAALHRKFDPAFVTGVPRCLVLVDQRNENVRLVPRFFELIIHEMDE